MYLEENRNIVSSTRDGWLTLLFSSFPYIVIAFLAAINLHASGIEAYLKSKAIESSEE